MAAASDERDEAEDAEHVGADLAESLVQACAERELTLAVAESLTGGMLSTAIATAPGAGDVYQGAVIAYQSSAKFAVLGVDPGPVVCASAAAQMASGAAERFAAVLAVAVTGVAGPDTQEGQPVGTVFMAVCRNGDVQTSEHHFDGDPPDVRVQTVRTALEQALERARDAVRPS